MSDELTTGRVSQQSLDRRLAKALQLLVHIAKIEAETGLPHKRRPRLEKLRDNLLSLGAVPGKEKASWPVTVGDGYDQPLHESDGWPWSVLRTPPWIEEHCRARHGGWFHPLKLGEGHPAIGDRCDEATCTALFVAGDVVFVMPFLPEKGDPYWLVQHRTCVAKQIFGDDWEVVVARAREARATGDGQQVSP